MFANLSNLLSRRTQPDYDRRFVREIAVSGRAPRNRRMDLLIRVCWVLIAVKCVGVVWIIHHYRIPFGPQWIIGPTVAFAALCTAVYYGRK
jgi:hypothetical protein